ncbi:hypothetical protein T4B_14513 [Trichinella pseudospiralis]|uniref:Uncharacterized protein n=1 Tax=Trichinella pseudospiralis TaxID=6337 RepID=A0A0V1E1Z5_TRIPS|nr:hypothetical protein T4A_13809 [Trichinella pseudospiralis]KRZ12745.1 hypothetical protein T4B_14513 [Trichinella pseudospiralis]
MADFSEQRLVPTRSNSISLVCERRAYKLSIQKKHYICSKVRAECAADGFKSDGRDRKLSKKPSGKETKPIPAIYDEEASNSSSEQSISDNKLWGIDGTFKVVPQWYQQLFTIHAFMALWPLCLLFMYA